MGFVSVHIGIILTFIGFDEALREIVVDCGRLW